MSVSLSAKYEKALIELEIVPFLLSEMPMEEVEVHYKKQQIKCGEILTSLQTEHPPTILKYPAKYDKFYTLLLLDADVPSRKFPKYKFWLHWLVVDIPGNNHLFGDELGPYIGPFPASGTGLHRLIFIVYEQGTGTHFNNLLRLSSTSPDYRAAFDLDHFVEAHGLLKPARAVNIFQVKYDASCKRIYDQLTPILQEPLLKDSTWLG